MLKLYGKGQGKFEKSTGPPRPASAEINLVTMFFNLSV